MKIILIILSSIQLSVAQEIKIMSYNIRLATVDDGENNWENRKNKVASLISYYEPDFVGMQETQKLQMDFLLQKMPQFKSIGNPRTKNKNAEYSNIFYNTSRYDLILQYTFWLSQTPDSISKGWDSAYPRIATYGLFKLKNSEKFIWVINSHFDHIRNVARIESAKLIVEKIEELKKTKSCDVIFMGDLNSKPDEEPIKYLNQHFYETRTHCITEPYGGKDTWNGFIFKNKPSGQIDYIFIGKNSSLQIRKHITIDDFYNFKYPSDHLPIMTTLSY